MCILNDIIAPTFLDMKKSTLAFPDFHKLDIRVGEILATEVVEKSRNLIAMKVNLGDEYGIVDIVAGIGEFYEETDLMGKKCLFVANLEPRKMMSRMSNGMMLAGDEKGRPYIISVSNDLPAGLIVR